MQNVMMPVPPDCWPVIVRLMTPVGAAGSGQSLFAPDRSPPYVSATSLPFVATRPKSAAPFGPHDPPSSLHATNRTRLVLERKSERHMCHHCVAEPVVLDDVLEDALETGACPAS